MPDWWHWAWERQGAPQLNNRFLKLARRPMTGYDWSAWMAVKAIVETALRAKSTDVKAAAAYLTGDQAALDGFKGARQTFRPWDRPAPPGALPDHGELGGRAGAPRGLPPREEHSRHARLRRAGQPLSPVIRFGPMTAAHALRGLLAVSSREVVKFAHQTGRLISALVRPSLWLLVFAAGFQNVFGVSIIPPYETYIRYEVYVVPGLLGMVLLFNGMQSSLSMVYDREMGIDAAPAHGALAALVPAAVQAGGRHAPVRPAGLRVPAGVRGVPGGSALARLAVGAACGASRRLHAGGGGAAPRPSTSGSSRTSRAR